MLWIDIDIYRHLPNKEAKLQFDSLTSVSNTDSLTSVSVLTV